MMNQDAYSPIEAMFEMFTPLRWSETSGGLVVDETELQNSGARYAKLWLMLSAMFVCVSFLLGDLLFAASATAKLATVVTGGLALTNLAVAAAITTLKRKRR
jgi:hypothetical protein